MTQVVVRNVPGAYHGKEDSWPMKKKNKVSVNIQMNKVD